MKMAWEFPGRICLFVCLTLFRMRLGSASGRRSELGRNLLNASLSRSHTLPARLPACLPLSYPPSSALPGACRSKTLPITAKCNALSRLPESFWLAKRKSTWPKAQHTAAPAHTCTPAHTHAHTRNAAVAATDIKFTLQNWLAAFGVSVEFLQLNNVWRRLKCGHSGRRGERGG